MIEYRVKPVTRYIVTRFEGRSGGLNEPVAGSVTERGEFANADTAFQVASALCKLEHEKSGEPVGSMDFIYPVHPSEASVMKDCTFVLTEAPAE